MSELVFVVGCNAAGKSTLIRSRLDELEDFKIPMTDVYKARTKELAIEASTTYLLACSSLKPLFATGFSTLHRKALVRMMATAIILTFICRGGSFNYFCNPDRKMNTASDRWSCIVNVIPK